MKKVGSLLPRAIEKEVLDVAAAQGILKHWDEIVGPALAARSWPDRYERAVVWVAVEGSAWAQELRLQKEVILSRLRERGSTALFGDVRFGVRKLPARVVDSDVAVVEVEVRDRSTMSIREIAEERLKRLQDASGD